MCTNSPRICISKERVFTVMEVALQSPTVLTSLVARGVVMGQDISLLPFETVSDVMWFYANLTLPRSYSVEKKRCHWTLHLLHVFEDANTSFQRRSTCSVQCFNANFE